MRMPWTVQIDALREEKRLLGDALIGFMRTQIELNQILRQHMVDAAMHDQGDADELIRSVKARIPK